MTVLALDPGTEKSALLHWDGKEILLAVLEPNGDILKRLEEFPNYNPVILVIEMVEGMGMPVGQETFETVFWSGRFAQIFGFEDVRRMGRKAVKRHICGSTRATDANIRAALIDRFGGEERAVGKKRSPGPLYDINQHLRSALALAITWMEENQASTPGTPTPEKAPIEQVDPNEGEVESSEELDPAISVDDATIDGW